jgi:hypothetical protein
VIGRAELLNTDCVYLHRCSQNKFLSKPLGLLYAGARYGREISYSACLSRIFPGPSCQIHTKAGAGGLVGVSYYVLLNAGTNR